MAAKRILDLEDVNDPNHAEPTELKTEFIELGDVSVIPRDLAVQPYSPARQSSLLMSPSSAQSCSTRKLGELVDVKTELADASVIFREPYSPARQLSLVMSPCSAQSCSAQSTAQSPANNKKQETEESRARISKRIQEIDQLCPRSRKMQAYDKQRIAKVDHDQVALKMKTCELNLKLAILEVTEVKSILERRKLLNDSYNEMIIID